MKLIFILIIILTISVPLYAQERTRFGPGGRERGYSVKEGDQTIDFGPGGRVRGYSIEPGDKGFLYDEGAGDSSASGAGDTYYGSSGQFWDYRDEQK